MTNEAKIISKIHKILLEIKPFINQDGGDVVFVKYAKGILTLKVMGKCVCCPSFSLTFNEKVKTSLMKQIPEIKKVNFIV